MKFEFYTDGACSLQKINGKYERGFGGAAGALFCDDEVLFKFLDSFTKTTNNEMELYAILKAMYQIYTFNNFYNRQDSVVIYSDSAYSINCINTWAKNWERNGWTRGTKHEKIKNLQLIKAIYYFKPKFGNISFQKVSGHSSNRGNDYVDKLAVRAKYKAREKNINTDIEILLNQVNDLLKGMFI